DQHDRRGQRAPADEAHDGRQRRPGGERREIEAALMQLPNPKGARRNEPDNPCVHSSRLSFRKPRGAGHHGAISARANSSESNGRRSSTDSPTPISLTG